MVTTLLKSALREIRQSLGRYLAILAIIGLGVGFFAGLRMCQPDMMATGVKYVRDYDFYDFRLLSTLGFTGEDVDYFAALDWVETAQGSVYTEFLMQGEEEESVLVAHMLTPGVNTPELIAGRMPEKGSECLADGNVFSEEDIGRTVRVAATNDEDTLELMAYDEYTIVGLAATPLYLNYERGTASIGSGNIAAFVLIPEEGFDYEAYYEVYLTIKQGLDAWSDGYEDQIQAYKDLLDPLCRQRADLRYENIYDEAMEELSDAEQELSDGWEEYRSERADAERELSDAFDELTEGEEDYAQGLADFQQGRQDYEEGLREYYDGLEELADAERELSDGWIEYEEGKAEAEQELADALVKLQDGEAEYADGLGQYEEGLQQAQDGEKKLLSAKMEMDATARQLDDSKAQLDSAKAQLDSAKAQLDALGSQLEMMGPDSPAYQQLYAQHQMGLAAWTSGMEQYESGMEQYQTGLYAFIDGTRQLRESEQELADAFAELEEAKQELDDARRELDDGWQEYHDGKAEAERELADAHKELTDGQQELIDGKAELADAWQELQDAESEIAEGEAELADARTELDDGWQEYYDGLAEAEEEFADAETELHDAEVEIADAYEELEELKEADVYLLTRKESIGYASFDNDTSIIAAISVVFPLFFFAVAALVCMTTMKRMVDEQRTQIGVLKALGYSRGQIIGKFLLYSGSAATIGSVVGYALGSTGMPLVIWEIYGIMYGFAPLKVIFDPVLAAISFAAALLCSMGSTYVSCRAELQRPAAELIRPKTPKAGKRVFLEYITPVWKRLDFLHKVSVRNVLRYRSRLVMMVLGIGGCTALLVTGFGLRDSLAGIVDSQFDQITQFDFAVNFTEEQSPEDVAGFLAQHGYSGENALLVHSGSTDITSRLLTKTVYLVVSSQESLEGFIDLHTMDGEAIPFPKEGEVVLNNGLAESLDVTVGDSVTLRSDDLGAVTVTVSAICENYINDYAYLSPASYAAQTGQVPPFKTLYLLAPEGADHYGESVKLAAAEGVSNVSVSLATRTTVSAMLERLDLIVVVVVICAAALAFIVLYNLTNINITERIREIATIKVLGFYQKETASYVFREIRMLSAVGSLAGLLMGKALHAYVMLQVKVDGMFFPARVFPASYLISLVLTLVFTTLITWSMQPKLKKVDMAESLKSIE